jgi:hypothetical protein
VLIGSQGDQEITFEEMADRFSSVHTEIHLMAGRPEHDLLRLNPPNYRGRGGLVYIPKYVPLART